MREQPITLTIVFDPEFGDRVSEAALLGPVWATASAANRLAIERYWRMAGPNAHQVTYWSEPRTGNTEEEWIRILDDLDLHHSQPWAGPGIAGVHVVGAPISEHARKVLRDFGYEITHAESASFRAIRLEERTFDAPAP